MDSDSKMDIDESPFATISQMGDKFPSSSLFWGEEIIPNNDNVEASTSRGNEQNESNIRE